MKATDITYKVVKSQHFDEQLINKFISIQNNVFNINLDRDYFIRKFCDNIYGPSIIVLAYYKGEVVGADALWRNDIYGRIAYQSSDTCVDKNFRGYGIFKTMVNHKLSNIEKEAIVYGFPNENSYGGFMKLGWHSKNLYTTIHILSFKPCRIDRHLIDYKYASWWFNGKINYYFTKIRGKYYLIKKRKTLIYSVIGELEYDAIKLFPYLHFPLILLTKSDIITARKRIIKRINPFISLNKRDIDLIPCWKIDTI